MTFVKWLGVDVFSISVVVELSSGFIFRKVTTIFKTRLHLKEKRDYILVCHIYENATGGEGSWKSWKLKYTQHEQFNAILNGKMTYY